jgi:hypothetical protein
MNSVWLLPIGIAAVEFVMRFRADRLPYRL